MTITEFFIRFCRTSGEIPNCETCSYNVDAAGCQHPLNPANKEATK